MVKETISWEFGKTGFFIKTSVCSFARIKQNENQPMKKLFKINWLFLISWANPINFTSENLHIYLNARNYFKGIWNGNCFTKTHVRSLERINKNKNQPMKESFKVNWLFLIPWPNPIKFTSENLHIYLNARNYFKGIWNGNCFTKTHVCSLKRINQNENHSMKESLKVNWLFMIPWPNPIIVN